GEEVAAAAAALHGRGVRQALVKRFVTLRGRGVATKQNRRSCHGSTCPSGGGYGSTPAPPAGASPPPVPRVERGAGSATSDCGRPGVGLGRRRVGGESAGVRTGVASRIGPVHVGG